MSTISAGTTSGTALVNSGDTTGQLILQTNGTTTAVTIGTNQVVTLAQPLPVASGGTGTTSSTFVNLATNVTGTLPIANGGTGTTSTTFVNLATNVTGTLPVGNGGTGQTSLTANNVILGNGASAVQFVAPGTNGNILTSNGTTWQSTAPAGGGSWIWLSTVSATSGTYANVETTFNSTYDVYAITISGARPNTDTVDLRMELKLGGSYRTSADYKYHLHRMISGNTSYSATVSGGQSYMVIAEGVEGDIANTINYVIYVMNPSQTLSSPVYHLFGQGSMIYFNNSQIWGLTFGGGYQAASSFSPLEGVRFYWSSGQWSTGNLRLYGIKNS